MKSSIKPGRVRLAIESRLENVFLIGQAVRAYCSHLPFEEAEAYQVELSVVEAVNNAIKHAYGFQPGHEVELIVFLYPDRIVFEVCDTGQPMDEFHKAEMAFDCEDLETVPEGGMGLYLMQSLMDHVSYETINGRNILRMTKYFRTLKKT